VKRPRPRSFQARHFTSRRLPLRTTSADSSLSPGRHWPAANGALVGDLLRSAADAGRAFAFPELLRETDRLGRESAANRAAAGKLRRLSGLPGSYGRHLPKPTPDNHVETRFEQHPTGTRR
jgi:hypothetical protein